MNAMTDVQNINWALARLWIDDDRERNDAREIICELGLAGYDEYDEHNDCDEANEYLRRVIRERAREKGWGVWID